MAELPHPSTLPQHTHVYRFWPWRCDHMPPGEVIENAPFTAWMRRGCGCKGTRPDELVVETWTCACDRLGCATKCPARTGEECWVCQRCIHCQERRCMTEYEHATASSCRDPGRAACADGCECPPLSDAEEAASYWCCEQAAWDLYGWPDQAAGAPMPKMSPWFEPEPDPAPSAQAVPRG